MLCKNCGNKIDNSSDFCPCCGTAVDPDEKDTAIRKSNLMVKRTIITTAAVIVVLGFILAAYELIKRGII